MKAQAAPVVATTPGRQSRKTKFDIEADLRARLAEYETTPEWRDRVERCVSALEAVAQTLGSRWHVSPFGSAANGFGTKVSDLDATCYEEPEEGEKEEDQESRQSKQPASGILGESLAPLLRKHPQFTMAEEVLNARVPILKLCFEGKLEVDLSCYNTMPLHNTQLLKAYSALDERVKDLVIAVKLWAKAQQVCGASKSHLSSYSLTLMTIYFMQVHPKIKLPMLPVQAFKDGSIDGDARLQAARESWSCSFTLGQLVLRFFQFYSQEFYWGTEVVSVRLGSRLDANQPFFTKLRARHFQRLHVEDPVDPMRNLNCVLGEVQEMKLREMIQDTYKNLQQGKHFSIGVQLGESLDAEVLDKPLGAFEPGQVKRVPSEPTEVIKVGDLLKPGPVDSGSTPVPSVQDHLDPKSRSLSEASTTSSPDSCASSTDEAVADVADDRASIRSSSWDEDHQCARLASTTENEKEDLSRPGQLGCAEDKTKAKTGYLVGDLEGLVGTSKPQPSQADQKHALLQLLHGNEQKDEQKEQQPQVPASAPMQSGPWPTRPRLMSKASRCIAAKVATACTSKPVNAAAVWQ
eukprot:TRINITY_DN23650_c0_g1_i1.p1 TRINITY_DN23650_c0_g1~~TRINITY_DN23650_c0_g1_i1.p1  ORF type:complete len:629 (-),score=141.98 TRINITY_DN23650_c0_g1_i1:63-1793(-)